MFQVKCCRHRNLWGSEESKQSRWSSYKAVGMSAGQLFKFQQFKQTKQGSPILKGCCYITKISPKWTAVIYWDHSNAIVLQTKAHLHWYSWSFVWSLEELKPLLWLQHSFEIRLNTSRFLFKKRLIYAIVKQTSSHLLFRKTWAMIWTKSEPQDYSPFHAACIYISEKVASCSEPEHHF